MRSVIFVLGMLVLKGYVVEGLTSFYWILAVDFCVFLMLDIAEVYSKFRK